MTALPLVTVPRLPPTDAALAGARAQAPDRQTLGRLVGGEGPVGWHGHPGAQA